MAASVRLLGSVDVASGGLSVRIGGAKPSGVLAMLALHVPRATSTEHLVRGLWGEDPPASAQNALQVYVSAVRKLLRSEGADVVRSGQSYRLVLGPVLLDIHDFEQHATQGRSALLAGDASRSEPLLSHALALVRGIPLDGLGDIPFSEQARPALQAQVTSTRLDLADAVIRSGRADEAVPVLELVLAEEPFAEHAWALLATAHYVGGRQAEALRTCRRARHVLVDELGLDPGPELSGVEDGILQQSLTVKPGAPVSGLPDFPGWPALPPLPAVLVGQGDQLAALEQAIADHRLVSIVGLGGLGKTTLALSLAHRLVDAGRPVLLVPLEQVGDAGTALETVCSLAGLDPGDDPVAALVELSAGSVLVLDNVEQVDGLDAHLERLARSAAGVTVVVTSRRALDVASELILRVAPLAITGPNGSPGPAVELFVRQMSLVRGPQVRGPEVRGATTLTDAELDAVAEISAMCGGIPLALTVAAHRARLLGPVRLAQRFAANPDLATSTEGRPGTPARHRSLRAVIEDTVLPLGPGSRRVLGIVCAVPGAISVDLLARAVGDAEPVDDDLESLLLVDLVQVDPDRRLSALPPVRDVVRAAPGHDQHVLLLVDAVAALAAEVGPSLLGRDQARSVRLLQRDNDALQASLAAAIAGAVTSAVATSAVATSAAPTSAVATSAAPTSAGAASSAATTALAVQRYWLLTGQIGTARRWFDLILSLPGVGAEHALTLKLFAGTFASYVNDPSTADRLVPALEAAREAVRPVDRALVNAWCCLAAFRAHHDEVALAWVAADTAAELAASTGEAALIALARDAGGYLASQLGEWERCLQAQLPAVADARRSGDPTDLVNTLITLAEALDRLDRPQDAWEVLQEAVDIARDLEPGPFVTVLIVMRGAVLSSLDRPAAARGYLLESLHLLRSVHPDTLMLGDALFMLGGTYASSGDGHQAARIWGAARAVYTELGIEPGSRTPARFMTALEHARDVDPVSFDLQLALGMSDPERTMDRAR